MLTKRLDRRPDRGGADRGRRASAEVAGRVAQQHGRQHRRRSPDPPHRRRRERHHHRAGAVGRRGRGDPEPVQQRQHLALDQRSVPHGMFGLDEDLHRPSPVEHEPHQSLQGQQPGIALCSVGPPAAVPPAVVERPKLLQRHLADQSRAVGRAVHPAVVHTDQVPVAGQPHIALHALSALLQRQLVGRQRVLWAVGGRPPVGDHEGMRGLAAGRHGLMLPVPGLPAQLSRGNRCGILSLRRRQPSDGRAVRRVCPRTRTRLAPPPRSPPSPSGRRR